MNYVSNHRYAFGAAGALLLAIAGVVYAGNTDVQYFDRGQLQVRTSTTDVDVSAAVYTGHVALVTIEPPGGTGLRDLKITLDLDKTTTGFDEVHAAGTGQLAIQRKVDGSNWRTDIASIVTITGAAATNRSYTFTVGDVEPGSDVRVSILLSSEIGDMEFPYVATYRAPKVATFTDVAN